MLYAKIMELQNSYFALFAGKKGKGKKLHPAVKDRRLCYMQELNNPLSYFRGRRKVVN